MLEKTQATIRGHAAICAPLIVRRIDAIPVALPLKAPMKMAGVTITKAENLIVRVELQDGQVGWGEAPSAPTMTGDTLGSLVAAVRDHLAPLLIGKDATARSPADAAACARRQHRRAFGGRDGAARCGLPRDEQPADRRCRDDARAHRRRADVAARQCHRRRGHRRSAGKARARASISSSSRSA